MNSKITKLITFSFLTLSLSSCVGLALGGAGLVGYSLVQERTVGDAIDDIAIETEINALLLDKERRHLFTNVDIDSVEGRVLLTGKVPNRESKIEVYRLAWQPDAVKEVINEITVNSDNEFSAKRYAADAWISTQIESKLLFAKDIASVNYSVETINGAVYLMGVAKSKEELQKVAEIASTISGVERVVSHVRIKGKKYPKAIKPQTLETYNEKPTPKSDYSVEQVSVDDEDFKLDDSENTYNTQPQYLGKQTENGNEAY